MLVQIGYLALFFANAIGAALLRAYGEVVLMPWSPMLRLFSECDQSGGASCVGDQLVYRLSFSLLALFVVTTVMSYGRRTGWDDCWCLVTFQLPFYGAMLLGSMFVPNAFFDEFAEVARVLSGIFIVFQIVIIVDWAYNVRDYFLDRMETDEAARNEEARQALLESNYKDEPYESPDAISWWELAYLGLAILFIVLSIAGLALLFTYYAECALNLSFIVITVFLSAAALILSVLSRVAVGLIPSAAVCSYLVFLCYQAASANPDQSCSKFSRTEPWQTSMAGSAAIAAFTITWTCWQAASTRTHLLSTSSSPSATEPSQAPARGESTKLPGAPEYQFHLLMVLSSAYMAMVLTNWGNSVESTDNLLATMWIRIASQWVAAGVFLWTMLAPSLFPDRAFE